MPSNMKASVLNSNLHMAVNFTPTKPHRTLSLWKHVTLALLYARFVAFVAAQLQLRGGEGVVFILYAAENNTVLSFVPKSPYKLPGSERRVGRVCSLSHFTRGLCAPDCELRIFPAICKEIWGPTRELVKAPSSSHSLNMASPGNNRQRRVLGSCLTWTVEVVSSTNLPFSSHSYENPVRPLLFVEVFNGGRNKHNRMSSAQPTSIGHAY